MRRPRALTVAGSDPGGGAGIQQDLKTFQALGAWGMTAITAITVQDTRRVYRWEAVAPDLVAEQIRAVAADLGVDAAKTGMLPGTATIEAVARALADAGIQMLVVDPVLVATSGDALAGNDAALAIRELLLPRALLVTPNVDEAQALSGVEVRDRRGQEEAGRALVAAGARAALVTGGHLDEAEAVDVLVTADDVVEITGRRASGGEIHGSGCMLSAAIVARLAAGDDLPTAVSEAKAFVTRAIAGARALGGGARPVDPASGEDDQR